MPEQFLNLYCVDVLVSKVAGKRVSEAVDMKFYAGFCAQVFNPVFQPMPAKSAIIASGYYQVLCRISSLVPFGDIILQMK